MTLGKLASGSRLQIPLKANRPLLIWELDHDMQLPWPVTGGVRAFAGVMVVKSRPWVRGQANVITGRAVGILQDVDNLFLAGHAATKASPLPTVIGPDGPNVIGGAERDIAVLAMPAAARD
jgi:hypothetical protein